MKHVPKLHFNFKRSLAFTWALLTLSTSLFTVATVFLNTQTAHAQQGGVQAGYYWINAGTIKFNNLTYYDQNALDSNHEFILSGAQMCNYSYFNRSNIPYDRLIIDPGGTTGSHWVIDTASKDNFGTIKCDGIQTKIQLYDTAKRKFYLYQKGDVIYSYNNAISFVKSPQAGPNGGQIYTRDSEVGVQCADMIFHGNGGEYGNNWYIFPMGPKDNKNPIESNFKDGSTNAVSEHYAEITGTGDASKNNCRVDSWEIESALKIGFILSNTGCSSPDDTACKERQLQTGGISNNMFLYEDYEIVWGDDGYLIKAGIGTEDSAPPTDDPPPGDDAGNGTLPTPDTCDVAFTVTDIISLKWIICPLLKGAFALVRVLDDILNSQLQMDMTPFNDDSPYHLAWNAFRVLALGIIVLVALVMVITQATGIELFSAYTVRKLAGQFAFALIFISVSWGVAKVAFQASNDIAESIRTIIYAPFGQFPPAQLGGGSSFSLLLLTTGGILFLGPLGLLSFAATAALAIFITVVVFVLIHSIGYGVAMVAPVGIALGVLPNTRGVANFIKGAFISVWLAGPAAAFIMAFMRVLSVTTFNLNGTLYQIAAIIMYVGADFVVTIFLVRLGGAAANITGLINDRSRGMFDRLSKFRQNRVAKNTQAMAAGERFKAGGLMDKTGFNTFTKGATAFATADNKSAFFSLDADRRKAARDAAMEQHENILAARYGKTEKAQVAQHNDPLLRAQTYASEAAARANMAKDWDMKEPEVESAIAAAKINGGWGKQKQINAARRLFATGTGFDDLSQVHDTIARVAGKNENLAAAILGEGNSTTKGVGRHDLAAGFGKHMALYNRRMEHGSLSEADIQEGVVGAISDTDAVTWGRDKGKSIDNGVKALSAEIARQQAIVQGGGDGSEAAQAEVIKLNGMIETLKQSGSYFSGTNVQKLAQGVGQPTIQLRETIQQDIGNASQKHVMETVSVDASGNVVQPGQQPAAPPPQVITLQPPPGGGSGQPQAAPQPIQIQMQQPAGPVQTITRPVVAGQDAQGKPIYLQNPDYNQLTKEANEWHSPQRGIPYNRDNDPRLN